MHVDYESDTSSTHEVNFAFRSAHIRHAAGLWAPTQSTQQAGWKVLRGDADTFTSPTARRGRHLLGLEQRVH